jgi:vacuolar-type H+-ATPase subunit E/Vma4
MPESFQLFYQIQQEAAEEVRQILENVKAGKTTIEEEKLKRGIK